MCYGIKLENRDGSLRKWFQGTLVGFMRETLWTAPTREAAQRKADEMQGASHPSDGIRYVVTPLPMVAECASPAPAPARKRSRTCYVPTVRTSLPERLDGLQAGQWVDYQGTRGRYMGRRNGVIWIAWRSTASKRFHVFAQAFRTMAHDSDKALDHLTACLVDHA